MVETPEIMEVLPPSYTGDSVFATIVDEQWLQNHLLVDEFGDRGIQDWLNTPVDDKSVTILSKIHRWRLAIWKFNVANSISKMSIRIFKYYPKCYDSYHHKMRLGIIYYHRISTNYPLNSPSLMATYQLFNDWAMASQLSSVKRWTDPACFIGKLRTYGNFQ